MEPNTDDQTISLRPQTDSSNAEQPTAASKVVPTGELPTQAATPHDHEATLSLRGDTEPNSRRKFNGRHDLPKIAGYELIDYLAEGGMGVVYRARDITLDRIVAIKMPRAGYVGTPQERERFLREARSAARLRHPHICPIYEVRDSIAGQQPYICLAFIDGTTLRGWLQKTKPSPARLAEMMAIIARTVHFAHDQGVVHRDLKPSNVMVETKSESPMLMDFGLAKDMSLNDGLTMSGDLLGTPAYMAPEQAAGKANAVGPAADIYSLGAMLYDMLAGQPPFQGTLSEVLQQVQNAEPPSIRRQNPVIHRDLETICVKAMAKRPNERYASANSLADDLERFARGEPILARRRNVWQHAWRLTRKYPLVTGLAATLAIVLTGVSLAMPRVARTLHVTRTVGTIQASLNQADWTPVALVDVEPQITELQGIAPTEAASMEQQVSDRLERYINEYLRQGRLTDTDRQSIEDSIALLEPRSASRATELRRVSDRRFGLWERTVDFKAPFVNRQAVQAVLPELEITSDNASLVTQSEEPILSTQPCEGNFQVELNLNMEPGSQAAVLLNAHGMHQSWVSTVVISPDEQTIATGSIDGKSIFIWDARSGDEIYQLETNDRGTTGLAHSPDSQTLYSSSRDGNLRVWNLKDRVLQQTIRLPTVDYWQGTVGTSGPPLIVSPDGKHLFVGVGDGDKGGKVLQYALPEMSLVASFVHPSRGVLRLACDHSCKSLVATTRDSAIQVWDLATGKLRKEVISPPQTEIVSVAMNGRGEQIAASFVGGIVKLYSADTLSELASLQGYEAGCYSLSYDPSGNVLAAGYENGTIKLWDTTRMTVLRTLPDHRNRCFGLQIAPSGDWGVAANAIGSLRVWDFATATERFSWGLQNYTFMLQRSLTDRSATLSIRRGTAVLREVQLPLRAGTSRLVARREGEQLQLQVDQHPPLIFQDYFPPRAVERGHWGLFLENTKVEQLVVRRSIAAETDNALQKGDELFRRGQFADALDAYTEQLAASSTEKNSRTHKEALLKTALCFVRLNRPEDARRTLMELAQSTEDDPIIVQAKFQLWTLLLSQDKYSDADALCQTLRLQHPLPKITGVISEDMRREIFEVYSRSLSRRRHLLQPGIAERLAALQEVARYFEMDDSALDGTRWQIVTALRLQGRTEESLPHLVRFQQVLDKNMADVRSIDAVYLLEDLRRRGYVDRALGQPSRMTDELAKLLESTRSTLEARANQTLPSVNAWLQAIRLEQIRMLAAEDRWSEVVDPLQSLMDEPAELLEVIVDGGLLLGFAYLQLDKVEQANQAWQKAAALMPQNSVFGSDMTDKVELVPRMMWLRGLSGNVTEEEFRKDLQFLQQRLSSMPGTDAILDQFPVSFAMMKRLCHSESGYKRIQQSAMGNSSVVEDVGSFLVLLASQMMWEGAFGEEGTAEQRAAINALAQKSFHAYVDNQLSLPTFLQLGLAWKGLPAPLGWQFLLSSLPESMRAEVAYVLGKRFERKQNQGVAKALWQIAVDGSSADSKVHQLAKEALAP